jgi:iron complex outermembrane receptor protein
MKKNASLQIDSTIAQINPVARAVRQQLQCSRRNFLAAAVLSSAVAMPQVGMAQELLEEIVVTASKRAENLQDVPMAIVALDSTTLSEQAISSFEDYALTLSNVAFKSFGYPGSATMYMRGAADGGDGNSSGSTPSVCLYMDEQPVTAIAANLDVHIYDINRIEALAGPQGTLFGASCQSGSLRIITNKPDPSQFSAGFDLGATGTSGGDPGYSVEGFLNAPIGDNAAIRLVGWSITEGGWIDNVPGTRNYTLNAPWVDTAPPPTREVSMNNDEFVNDNINELDKVGMRAALGVDLNDNWTLDVGVLYQKMETEGIWEHDPYNFEEDHKIQRFNDESSEDEFTQLSLTLEGEFANHTFVYAGSFLDRESAYMTDYSAYGDYLTWVDYYACDGTGSETDCTSLNEFATRDNEYERSTHELRLLSMGDSRLHYTIGAFFQQNEHRYLQLWRQPEMAANVSVPGYGTDDVYFRTDQVRDLDQTAIFGEVGFDFTDSFSGTVGARWFDEEASLEGVVGWGPSAYDPARDPDAQDTPVDSSVSASDTIFKVNLSWNLSDDAMTYFTWSEGYRPGGINREPALPPSAVAWEPDYLTNYEIGWKTMLAGGKVRFNGAVYFMDWEDIQYTVYDSGLSFCCGNVYNLSTAESKGVEADITWQASDAFSLAASVSFNSAETTANFILPLGAGDPLSVPSGTPLPNVPEFKANISGRYEFSIGEFGAFAQLVYSYTGDSQSSIRPIQTPDAFRFPGDFRNYPQSSYAIANLRAGFGKDGWGVDLFVNNLTDEVADYFVHPRNYEPSTVTNRPLSYGAKLWMRF